MSEQVVILNNIDRNYELKGETVNALRDVSLSVEAGEFLVLAGPSGSGKSTMLNIIGALDRPSAGSVNVDGKAFNSLSEKELALLRRDRIGFVFQAFNLIPVLTIRENVEYVMLLQGIDRSERDKRTDTILAELGLDGLADRRPAELSGGQQQRAAVARAIVSEPAIVLADEPTANLDHKNGTKLLDMMEKLNQTRKTTFIFSTHDYSIMKRASRLVILRDGKIDKDEVRNNKK